MVIGNQEWTSYSLLKRTDARRSACIIDPYYTSIGASILTRSKFTSQIRSHIEYLIQND